MSSFGKDIILQRKLDVAGQLWKLPNAEELFLQVAVQRPRLLSFSAAEAVDA